MGVSLSQALALAYCLMPDGTKSTGAKELYAYTFALNKAKRVMSLTLPNNGHVVVLAATLVPAS